MEITYNELNTVLLSLGFKDISTDKYCAYTHEKSEAFIGLPSKHRKILDEGHVAMVTHTLWGFGFLKERKVFYKLIERVRLDKEIEESVLV